MKFQLPNIVELLLRLARRYRRISLSAAVIILILVSYYSLVFQLAAVRYKGKRADQWFRYYCVNEYAPEFGDARLALNTNFIPIIKRALSKKESAFQRLYFRLIRPVPNALKEHLPRIRPISIEQDRASDLLLDLARMVPVAKEPLQRESAFIRSLFASDNQQVVWIAWLTSYVLATDDGRMTMGPQHLEYPDHLIRLMAAYQTSQHLKDANDRTSDLHRQCLPILTEGATNMAFLQKTFPAVSQWVQAEIFNKRTYSEQAVSR